MARIAEAYLSTLSTLMTPHGLERHFMAFLFLCENSGKVTQNDLAQRLKKDRVSAMRIVDYLCERQLVIRTKDEKDRRCHLLEVTEKARKLLPTVKDAIQQTNHVILENLSPADHTIFSRSMAEIKKKIDSLPDPEFIIQAHRRKNNTHQK